MLPDEKLAHKIGRERRTHRIGDSQRVDASIHSACSQCTNHLILAASLDDSRDIEHVARLKPRPTVMDLFSNDLCRSFKADLPTVNLRYVCRILGQRSTTDKIDFANIFEKHLYDMTAIGLIFIREFINLVILCRRIQEWQQLWIVKK